jgi:hypothetical protein
VKYEHNQPTQTTGYRVWWATFGEQMKHLLYFIALLMASGCSDSRWYHEFELGEQSFDTEVMQLIKDDSELALPEGTRGLNFRYRPPMDPSFIARLAIPEESVELVRKQIEVLKNEKINISGGLREKTAWWSPESGTIIIDRECHQADNDYFRAILTREENQVVLYLDHAVF